MIRFCLFFLLLVKLYAAPSLVFIHLGPKLPDYLPVALSQARLFNPTLNLYLVGNEEALKNLSSEIKKSHPILVSCESLPKLKFHKKFLKESKLDKKFRQGFWTFTTERFFYLAELIQAYELTDVFHLENDVMLYEDLTLLAPIFQAHYQNQIGATFDNDERCIPGIVYVSSFAPIAQLTDFIASLAHKGLNDMEFLARFKQKYLGKWIDHLPILTPAYALDHPLVSPNGAKGTVPSQFFHHFAEFHSLFDAAALGQFLGGIDPANGASQPGFINERCVFNPSLLTFEWRKDEKGRRVPFALYKDTVCKINNLHIHSKDLLPFFSGEI